MRLLFTDIQMPGECNGMQLAAKVHARWPHVLLIVTCGRLSVSGEDMPHHGCFIAKPYPVQELVKQVSSLIADQKSGALR